MLQAGWEDRVDFDLNVYRDITIASPQILTSPSSFEILTPIDLDALEAEEIELEPVTGVCEAGNIQHERPVVFCEFISLSSNSSSEVETLNGGKNLNSCHFAEKQLVLAGDLWRKGPPPLPYYTVPPPKGSHVLMAWILSR